MSRAFLKLQNKTVILYLDHHHIASEQVSLHETHLAQNLLFYRPEVICLKREAKPYLEI